MAGLAMFAVGIVLTLSCQNSVAQRPISEVQKDELAAALSLYSKCNAACSAAVAGNVLDQGVDASLAFVAALAATPANKKTAMAAWYVFARTVFQGGSKVVSNHGACAAKCDAMYSDIVSLGQAGVLGPLLKDGKVNEAALNNPKVVEAYSRYLKPLPSGSLPWQFHNEKWWDKVNHTA